MNTDPTQRSPRGLLGTAQRASVSWPPRRRPPPDHGLQASDHERAALDHGRPPSDRGSATVWAVALVAVLLVVGAAGIDLVSAVRARHVAGSAADLSALAAAGRSSEGPDGACAVARSTAERNGAVLRECLLDGWDAVVRVEVGRTWTLLGRGPAEAGARAGPAPDDGTGAAEPVGAS